MIFADDSLTSAMMSSMMPSGFLRVFGLEVVVVGDDGAGLDLAGLHAVGDLVVAKSVMDFARQSLHLLLFWWHANFLCYSNMLCQVVVDCCY